MKLGSSGVVMRQNASGQERMSFAVKIPGTEISAAEVAAPFDQMIAKNKAECIVEVSKQSEMIAAFKECQKALELVNGSLTALEGRNKYSGLPNDFLRRSVLIQPEDFSDKGLYAACTVADDTPVRSFYLAIQQIATQDASGVLREGHLINSLSNPLGVAGDFLITAGDSTTAIPLRAEMTLPQICSAINYRAKVGGYKAYINTVKPESGSSAGDGAYILEIQGAKDGVPLNFAGDVVAGLNLQASGKTVADLSAIFYVNGVRVVRSGNLVSDVLDGVTLNLIHATPNPLARQQYLRCDIVKDVRPVLQTVTNFATAVLNYYELMDKYCAIGPDGLPVEGASLLVRNAEIQKSVGVLDKSFAVKVAGLKAPSICIPEQVGFSWILDRFKKSFLFNQSILLDALETKPDEVHSFFSFRFESNHSKVAMARAPLNLSDQLKGVDIQMKIEKDGGNALAAAFKTTEANWVPARITPQGEVSGVSGTPYAPLQLYCAADFLQSIPPGGDPTVVTFNLTQGFADTLSTQLDHFTGTSEPARAFEGTFPQELKSLEGQKKAIEEKYAKKELEIKKSKEKALTQLESAMPKFQQLAAVQRQLDILKESQKK